MKPRPGVQRRSSRPWRVSSFHLISLHRLGVTAQIFQSTFLTVVLHPARRHGIPFPSDWRIFYIPRPPTLRTSYIPAYAELVEVLACATEKLSLDWPNEPRESQSSKLDERFLSGSSSRDEEKAALLPWPAPRGFQVLEAALLLSPGSSCYEAYSAGGRLGTVWWVWWWLSATYGWISQRSWRRLSSLTPRSPALACSATRLTRSGLLKRSQLLLSSSCHDVRASQPLPFPPGSARPSKEPVGRVSKPISPPPSQFGEPAVVPLVVNAPVRGWI